VTRNEDKAAGTTKLGTVTGIDSRDEQLVEVNDHLWVSKDISDSILVATPAGNVVVNSGMPGNGGRHLERFRQVNDGPVAYLVITQCHADHFGGAHEIAGSATRIITHEDFPSCREYWRILETFYGRRTHKLWGPVLGDRSGVQAKLREVAPDITFKEEYRFELGGRAFELYAAPGGESEDGVVVWLPQDRTAITGNLFGPIFGNMPNLYTIRGDKIRSARRFIRDLDFVRSLAPAVIVTGHGVIQGEGQIDSALETLRGAVMHVHDYTVAGMNAGKTVHELMAGVSLPEHLAVGQAHGKLSWCVRAIWEEYAGWFHYDATTALYAVPPSAVAADVVELAGAGALLERAETYLQNAEPLHALHLVDAVLRVEGDNRRALQARVAAHQQLLDAAGGENFSEVMWLRSELEAAQKLLE